MPALLAAELYPQYLSATLTVPGLQLYNVALLELRLLLAIDFLPVRKLQVYSSP
jgi:hypothetical protein